MNLYLRLLSLLGQYILPREPQAMEEEVRTPFRVLPNDLDTNFHMNNGRFLTLMDLGRLDFMARVGMLWPAARMRIAPVLGATQMVFLRPLHLWQRFELITKLECWDHKWFVMTQRFECGGKVCAQGRVRGVFRKGGKTLAPAEVLRGCGLGERTSPVPSVETQAWLDGLRRGQPPRLAAE